MRITRAKLIALRACKLEVFELLSQGTDGGELTPHLIEQLREHHPEEYFWAMRNNLLPSHLVLNGSEDRDKFGRIVKWELKGDKTVWSVWSADGKDFKFDLTFPNTRERDFVMGRIESSPPRPEVPLRPTMLHQPPLEIERLGQDRYGNIVERVMEADGIAMPDDTYSVTCSDGIHAWYKTFPPGTPMSDVMMRINSQQPWNPE